MKGKAIIDIINRCIEIAREASETFGHLAAGAQQAPLKKFWEDFIQDYDRHFSFWENLLDSAGNGLLPHVFEQPENTLEELHGLHKKVVLLKQRSESAHSTAEAFLIAFKLEFYQLHPAFETLYQYSKTLSDEKTPGDDSNQHISRLFESLDQYNLVTIELELLGETLNRLWQENRKLAVQNNYDPLTGVLNRRGLFNAISHLSHLAQRNRNNVGIMMIDIDDFKRINDTYGHLFGDQILRYVAESIKKNIRASDVLGRYGGEEFLVFLSSIAPEALYAVGDKIRLAVSQGNTEEVRVTISIGLAQNQIVQDVEKELNALINEADEKLLLAKRSGKNRVMV